VKLDDEERALFDAILAGAASSRPFDGADEQLAQDAEKRALTFVARRRRQVPSKEEPS
jgi:hypothetical protein